MSITTGRPQLALSSASEHARILGATALELLATLMVAGSLAMISMTGCGGSSSGDASTASTTTSGTASGGSGSSVGTTAANSASTVDACSLLTAAEATTIVGLHGARPRSSKATIWLPR